MLRFLDADSMVDKIVQGGPLLAISRVISYNL